MILMHTATLPTRSFVPTVIPFNNMKIPFFSDVLTYPWVLPVKKKLFYFVENVLLCVHFLIVCETEHLFYVMVICLYFL